MPCRENSHWSTKESAVSIRRSLLREAFETVNRSDPVAISVAAHAFNCGNLGSKFSICEGTYSLRLVEIGCRLYLLDDSISVH